MSKCSWRSVKFPPSHSRRVNVCLWHYSGVWLSVFKRTNVHRHITRHVLFCRRRLSGLWGGGVACSSSGSGRVVARRRNRWEKLARGGWIPVRKKVIAERDRQHVRHILLPLSLCPPHSPRSPFLCSLHFSIFLSVLTSSLLSRFSSRLEGFQVARIRASGAFTPARMW